MKYENTFRIERFMHLVQVYDAIRDVRKAVMQKSVSVSIEP